MKKENLETLRVSEIKSNSEYMTSNFIASNNKKDPLGKNFSLEHPFSFDGVLFGICTKGKANLKINFKEYTIEEDSIVTILPGSILETFLQTDDFFIEILMFAEQFVTEMPLPRDIQIIKILALNPVLKIQNDDTKNLLCYHSFIIDIFERRKESPYLSELINGLLYSMIIELAALYMENPPNIKKKKSRYDELTETFFRLLFENYKKERTATFYADRLFVTPKHLSYILKEVTGNTINAWIDQAVVIGAKSLLKSGNDTVLQISHELNFPTASYFGRFFKRMTGMTPLEYRDR